jgi:hypothetical protein
LDKRIDLELRQSDPPETWATKIGTHNAA